MFKSGIGIDVSDHHVRFARVSHLGKSQGLFELVLPHGLIVDDLVVKPKTLHKELVKLAARAGLETFEDNAAILLPESRVFSTSMLLKRHMKADELKSEALAMAQRDIPIPASQSYMDVHKGVRVNDALRVSVMAVDQAVVKGLVQAFSGMAFSVELMEPNSLALFRLYKQYKKKEFTLPHEHDLVMIVDIGHRWTNITLYGKQGAVLFSRSIALRKLADTSKGVVKRFAPEMIDRICMGIQHAITAFQAEGLRIPLVAIGGVEGAQEEIMKSCSKLIKKCVIRRIGEIVHIDDISPEDLHTYGAAIGAGLRAARSGHFSDDHGILLRA